ncbi:MAG: 2,3-bisphosphoglycerate-independent phosphoglycerate mutase, partial [Pseudohongiellaceae bacterium]
MSTAQGTALLLILDGWGYREATDHNAIALARTPVWDRLWQQYPHTLIHTSGMKVGLPEGQMGNSEVGHMNLGAGRVVYQSLTRINKAISDGDFFANPALLGAVNAVKEHGSTLHVIGLLSDGGIHSHEDQIAALLQLARQQGCRRVLLHALLDGRDTPPRCAEASLRRFSDVLAQSGCGAIASISGRFYGMDRDKRWDRVEKAFNAICHGRADHRASSAVAGLQAAYARNESDEFVAPTLICADGEAPATIQDGDAVVFMNFRADRARELTLAFTDPAFKGFARCTLPRLSRFVTLTEYAEGLNVEVAFKPENLDNSLGEYLAELGKTQLRIAETEKYAHVTFFFSGGREQEYPGETRILVPSPKVATYDLQPEMSAVEVTDKLVEAIHVRRFDAIICNFANGDMVGHTGILSAAIKAVETLDACLGRITEAVLAENGSCLITADHGNVEQMLDPESGQAMTSHTTGPVPLVCVSRQPVRLQDGGSLCDVAPSLLTLMQLPIPPEMSGRSLVTTA